MKKMHELGKLITSVQERNDWSDRDLQVRAEQLGLTALSKSNFSRWRNSPVNSIKGSNIRDMAAVLGLSEAAVAQAALQSMGIHLSSAGTSSIDTALDQDANLSARDKTLVRALLGAMNTTEKGQHDERDAEDHEQEPRTEARGQEPTQPTPITRAGVSPAHEAASAEGVEQDVPRPDEYALAASDELSEGRALRQQQDVDAEGNQSADDWDGA
ncbi:hypothetical protein [Kocuria carniphila]|uniref:hypothetical protein n=1 Tax=Kocuria carniphila TaxID=262208 RepID=UPI0034CD2641